MRTKRNIFIRLPIYILKSPYYLLKAIRNLFQNIFKGVKFSIKKKITLNYLSLFTFIGIVTFAFMIGGFLRYELLEKSNQVYLYVDNTFDKYETGIYNFDTLNQRIQAIAEVENCGIIIDLNDDYQIISKRYNNFDYPKNIIEKIITLLSYKMYANDRVIYYMDPISEEASTASLKMLQPVALFYGEVSVLSIMLLICFVFGFVFLWFFGSLNNKSILKPIYSMTRTAENISITNMKEKIDVSQAKYELKDLAITLNDMLDRINKEYEKQKRFVSDVSHELRTPISIVNGYASMLKRWGKEDEAILDESIEAIIDEARNMQILVENLLTLVRADNQTLKFNKETFYMNELIEEVTSESLMINAKRQTIDCETLQPIKVHLDFQMIKQMLRIFVDNAVKYTPQGGHILIRCLLENNQCVIKIKDSGIGISKEDLPYIFDRFYRSDESRTRDTGGHGLGLSIAKAIVLGHGGKIKVKSKKDEGSEFIVILPIK